MTADDKQLIRHFKQGSAEALAVIYDKYVGLLVRVAGGLLNERSSAEDVVHDTFVKFVQSADTLAIHGSLKAYLVSCVTNRARDMLRKKVLPTSQSSLQAVTHSSPPQAAMQCETRQLVRQKLSTLPDEQRETVVLHVQADLTFREIAEMLGISENTAQSRCRYGMEKLRHLLDGENKP